jgi:hypothetical protein
LLGVPSIFENAAGEKGNPGAVATTVKIERRTKAAQAWFPGLAGGCSDGAVGQEAMPPQNKNSCFKVGLSYLAGTNRASIGGSAGLALKIPQVSSAAVRAVF